MSDWFPATGEGLNSLCAVVVTAGARRILGHLTRAWRASLTLPGLLCLRTTGHFARFEREKGRRRIHVKLKTVHVSPARLSLSAARVHLLPAPAIPAGCLPKLTVKENCLRTTDRISLFRGIGGSASKRSEALARVLGRPLGDSQGIYTPDGLGRSAVLFSIFPCFPCAAVRGRIALKLQIWTVLVFIRRLCFALTARTYRPRDRELGSAPSVIFCGRTRDFFFFSSRVRIRGYRPDFATHSRPRQAR